MKVTLFLPTLSFIIASSYAFTLSPPQQATAGAPMDVHWSMEAPGPLKNFGVIMLPWPSSWPATSDNSLWNKAQELVNQKFPQGTDPRPTVLIRTNNQASGSVKITVNDVGPTLLLAFANDKAHAVASWPRVDVGQKAAPPPPPPPPPPTPPTTTTSSSKTDTPSITTTEVVPTQDTTTTVTVSDKNSDSNSTNIPSTSSGSTVGSTESHPTDATSTAVSPSVTPGTPSESSETETSENLASDSSGNSRRSAIIGGAVAGSVSLTLLIIALLVWRRRRNRKRKLQDLVAPFTPRFPGYAEEGRSDILSEQGSRYRDEKHPIDSPTEPVEATNNTNETRAPEEPQTYNRAVADLAQRVMMLESLTRPPQYQPSE